MLIDNYRGVCLSGSIAKPFERIISEYCLFLVSSVLPQNSMGLSLMKASLMSETQKLYYVVVSPLTGERNCRFLEHKVELSLHELCYTKLLNLVSASS